VSYTISVIGLGYVGIPLAVEFSKKYKVIGFDINSRRISELKSGYDRTGEIQKDDLLSKNLVFTEKESDLKSANFHIVAVPTPINDAKQPDMSLVFKASASVGRNLKKGDIVVYESTVYPGATEEDCMPILEEMSGLKGGVDFKVGYSPERINPSDKEHTLTKIVKVVSGQDAESLEIVATVYGSVVTAGIYRAESIKVAEAAKVIENTQRDLNIAFVNELSLIFKRMNIDTMAVLKAAETKWNFLKFYPGLVGGHCIGVDPFYLTYKAEKMGYHPHVILAGRRINDGMGIYVARQTIELLIQKGLSVKGSRVNLLGLTFKENCPDVRNTRVLDIMKELERLGVKVDIFDPLAHAEEIHEDFGKYATPWEKLDPADALIVAAPHKQLKEMIKKDYRRLLKSPGIFVDVKGVFSQKDLCHKDDLYWRL
jgi:UDP-N-acetyl-D-glucosamine/UDP-N-acetyl-D-galactosamine dehydrogenase